MKQNIEHILSLFWQVSLFLLVAAWGLYFWTVPSAKHEENMAKLRRWWRSRRDRQAS
jgi:hypothetical protein